MDGAVNELAYVVAVLELAQHVEVRDRLLWRVEDGRVTFTFKVHDAFRWPGKDTEDISPEDVPVLRQARADLKAIQDANQRSCALLDLPILYTARKRHTAPLRDWLVTHSTWHLDCNAWEPVRKLLVAAE